MQPQGAFGFIHMSILNGRAVRAGKADRKLRILAHAQADRHRGGPGEPRHAIKQQRREGDPDRQADEDEHQQPEQQVEQLLERSRQS